MFQARLTETLNETTVQLSNEKEENVQQKDIIEKLKFDLENLQVHGEVTKCDYFIMFVFTQADFLSIVPLFIGSYYSQ